MQDCCLLEVGTIDAGGKHNGVDVPNLRVTRGEVTTLVVATAPGRPDIVVLDPGREGVGIEVTRDLRVLLNEDWCLGELRAFDIFPITQHLELVAAINPPDH
jgi:tRNA/tmRNA/rRNA uracil-C5-methylase (TrmA/RlmC/RlmD family)